MAGARVWRCGKHAFNLGERTLLMGIVNVTPDSFSDGGLFDAADAAIEHAMGMVADGVDIVDVGGESTRPGSDPVTADEERARVLPVIERLARDFPNVAISIDTRKAEVARAAVGAGAAIVNDISAGADPEMLSLAAESGVGLVLMHMKGEPKTMQEEPTYTDVVAEVRAFFERRVDAATATGIDRDCLCVDPGIGFGKNLEHNLALLRDIDSLRDIGVTLLVGPSRKRFIGTLTRTDDPRDRIEGTAGAVAWCAARRVDVVRVHDAHAMSRVVRVVDAIARGAAT